jgi:CBS domain-containing protein
MRTVGMSREDLLHPYRAPGPYGPAGEIVPKHQVLLQFEAHTGLREALERMLEENYTLAPVTHHGRTVGVLSIQSALRQLLADPQVQSALANRTAGEQIEEAVFVPAERWVDTDFDWQGDTAALVGDADEVLGIITHADLLRRVDDFARAFLVIAEIEMAFRMVLEALLPWSSCEAEYQRIFDAATNRTGDQYRPKKPDELTYWHYEMVLRDTRAQELLAPHVIVPCIRLADMTKTARLIRNDVMHFRRPASGDMVENLERLRLQLQSTVGSLLRQRVAQDPR